MTTLLIVGATGLVGRSVLEQALAEPAITRIVAPTRRALETKDAKLVNPVVDFDALPDADWWKADAVVCTLGTTMKQAGSKVAFKKVDYDYPVAIATRARAGGARAFGLVTAVGAKASSHFFYLRTKGEVEDAIAALGFESLTILRPSFLGGERGGSPRRMERLSMGLMRGLRAITPKRYRVVDAQQVAKTLLTAVREARPGRHVIESEKI